MRKNRTLTKLLLQIFVVTAFFSKVSSQPSLLINGGFESDTFFYPKKEFCKDSIWYPQNILGIGAYSKGWIFSDGFNDNTIIFSDSSWAYEGKLFAEITPYRLIKKSEIQIANLIGMLCVPLKRGNRYKVSFYVNGFRGNLFTNQIYCGFSTKFLSPKLTISKEELPENILSFPTTTYKIDHIVKNTGYEKIEFTYVAKGGEEYIYIGNINAPNFSNKNYIKTKNYGYGYWGKEHKGAVASYAIDNISVAPEDTTEDCISNKKTDTTPSIQIKKTSFEKNRPYSFDAIYFDFGKSEFTHTENQSLLSVLNFLKENSSYYLLITGSTDEKGNKEYNQLLSTKRAESVKKYFTKNGIDSARISCVGQGMLVGSMTDSQKRKVQFIFSQTTK